MDDFIDDEEKEDDEEYEDNEDYEKNNDENFSEKSLKNV